MVAVAVAVVVYFGGGGAVDVAAVLVLVTVLLVVALHCYITLCHLTLHCVTWYYHTSRKFVCLFVRSDTLQTQWPMHKGSTFS